MSRAPPPPKRAPFIRSPTLLNPNPIHGRLLFQPSAKKKKKLPTNTHTHTQSTYSDRTSRENRQHRRHQRLRRRVLTFPRPAGPLNFLPNHFLELAQINRRLLVVALNPTFDELINRRGYTGNFNGDGFSCPSGYECGDAGGKGGEVSAGVVFAFAGLEAGGKGEGEGDDGEEEVGGFHGWWGEGSWLRVLMVGFVMIGDERRWGASTEKTRMCR